MPYSKRVSFMSAPSFSTRRWRGLISNPGKASAGDCGGCMASSAIISARADMAFSTAFSSVSLNVSISILPTNLTSLYAVCPPKRNLNRAANNSEGRQRIRLLPLDYPPAKPGGAVNGGQSPFILPLTGSTDFAIVFQPISQH